jgi:hypothetical protein
MSIHWTRGAVVCATISSSFMISISVWLLFSHTECLKTKFFQELLQNLQQPRAKCKPNHHTHELQTYLTPNPKIIQSPNNACTMANIDNRTNCVRAWVEPRHIVLPEGLSMKSSNNTIGNRTRELPAGSAVLYIVKPVQYVWNSLYMV